MINSTVPLHSFGLLFQKFEMAIGVKWNIYIVLKNPSIFFTIVFVDLICTGIFLEKLHLKILGSKS